MPTFAARVLELPSLSRLNRASLPFVVSREHAVYLGDFDRFRQFASTGTAPGFSIGTRAGVGTISVTDNSTFAMTNLGDQALDDNDDPLYHLTADLRIGRGMDGGVGGDGTLEITTGGTFTLGGLTGTHKHGASIHVGREGGDRTINV